MLNKIVATPAEAVSEIKDGDVIMVAGFGLVGQPNAMINALVESGRKDLTIVTNNSGTGSSGLARLMATGRISKLICSFPRSIDGSAFEDQYRAGKIQLELVPQGTLAERIRAAGAGIGAFYTRTAAGTRLADGKESRVINGKLHVLEYPLHADVALIEAWRADRWGNLVFNKTSRNFNPIMAAAAKLTIAQTWHLADDCLDPETIVTPGLYVNRIVHVPDDDVPVHS
jgi:3-oxoadipate CoA-transferase, alpha subunit